MIFVRKVEVFQTNILLSYAFKTFMKIFFKYVKLLYIGNLGFYKINF